MPISRKSSALVMPALLACIGFACTVGPNYKREDVELPEGWIGVTDANEAPTTKTSQARQAYADVSRWWMQLDDPVLETLIQRAAESNLDLAQAASRIRQARGARGVSQSGLFPSVDTGARFSRSGSGPGDSDGDGDFITLPDGSVTRTGDGAESTERDVFRAGLDAAWELDVFGRIRRDVEAADADVRFAVEDYRNVLITLVSEVALNYTDLRQFQRQIDIAERNLVAQERTARVTRERKAGGEVSGLDVANAQAQVAATRSQIPSLRTQERQAMYNLAVLLGKEPGALLGTLSEIGPLPAVPDEVPIGLPSDLLRRRPDIRAAEERAHAATARIGVATADLFPRFTLTGSLGLQGDQARSLTNASENYFWSWGPSVSWPLFDAGRIRANIGIQEASQEEALLAYRATILTALQEVENALVAYTNEQERRESLIVAVEENRKAVDLSLKLYTLGGIEFLNVLQAQRALLASEDALVQCNSTVVTNLIALYKALGGGWDAPESNAESPTRR